MESHQGIGNFVRQQPTVRRYGIDRYRRSVWAGDDPQPLLAAEGERQGKTVGQSTEVEQVPAPDFVAGRGAGGHIARINAISPVLEVQEEITARMPSSPESARLNIPEGTPVFEVIRTYHTENGPLDVAKFVIRADMAAFDYRFQIPD